MQKIAQKLIKSIPFLLLLLVFYLHTVENVKEIATPPSENWSHALELAWTPSNVTPEISTNKEGDLYITYIDDNKELKQLKLQTNQELKTKLQNKSAITVKDFLINEEVITIKPSIDLSKTTELKTADNLLFFLNDNNLYALSQDNKNNWNNIQIPTLKNVSAFNWYAPYLVVSADNNLYILEWKDNSFSLLSKEGNYPAAKWLSVSEGNRLRELEIFAFVIEDVFNEQVIRSKYDLNSKKLVTNTLSKKTYWESSLQFSHVAFVTTGDELRLYKTYKYRSQSDYRRVLVYSLYDLSNNKLILENQRIIVPTLMQRETDQVEFVQSIINKGESSGEEDRLLVSALAKTGREKAGFRVVEMLVKDGKVTDLTYLSLSNNYLRNPNFLVTRAGDYALWLVPKNGGFNLMLSTSNREMLPYLNQTMDNRWGLAFGETFSDSMVIIISLLYGFKWALPPFIFFLFFMLWKSPEWVNRKGKILLWITTISYLLLQMHDLSFFYRAQIMNYMPFWLKFAGSGYIYSLGFALLILFSMLFIKDNRRKYYSSPIFSYFYFTIMHLLLLNLLYAPYLV